MMNEFEKELLKQFTAEVEELKEEGATNREIVFFITGYIGGIDMWDFKGEASEEFLNEMNKLVEKFANVI